MKVSNQDNLTTWNVLLIDDDQESFILVQQMLAGESLPESCAQRYSLDWAENCASGLDAVRSGKYDAVLLDYALGPDNGIDLLGEIRALGFDIPIIILTGNSNPEIDRQAMQAGATDFLDRGMVSPALLERTLRYTIRNYQLAQQTRAEIEQRQYQIEVEGARLKSVIQNAPAGILFVDQFGQFTLSNRAALNLLPDGELIGGASGPESGYSLRHLNGELFESKDLPIVRALNGETVVNQEMMIRHEDGTEVNTLVNASPIYGPQGVIAGAVAVVRDETDLLKAKAALAASEQRYRGLSELSPDAIFVLLDERFAFINQAGLKMFGAQEPADLIGKSFLDRVSPEVRSNFSEILQQITGDQASSPPQEIIFLRLDGAPFFSEVVIGPIENEGQGGSVFFARDISVRKNTEQALLESEERFRLASQSMRGFIWDFNLITGEVFRTDAVQAVTGYSAQELSGPAEKWFALIHPEDRLPENMNLVDILGSHGDTYSGEYRVRHKDGVWVWVQEHGKIIRDPAGAPVRIIGTTQDINARKSAELALMESEARFHTVLSNTPTVMFTLDQDLRYTWLYNGRHGFDPDGVVGKRDDELLDPESAEIVMAPKRQVLQTGKSVRVELVYQVNGQTVAYDAVYDPIVAKDGQVIGISSVAMDITDLVQLRRQQVEDRAQLEIQHHIIQQREQERMQIARDLHDGPLQDLTSIGFTLHGLLGQLENQPELQKTILEVKEQVEEQVAQLRSFATELRPPALVSFGLERAIVAHLNEFRAKNPELNCHFDVQDASVAIPEAPRMALYRIYQESLNNIVKHAQASEVHIRLKNSSDSVQLEISDNGSGFVIPTDWLVLARKRHLGLVGIRERAESLGGKVELISNPGAGTTLCVTIPVNDVQSASDSA